MSSFILAAIFTVSEPSPQVVVTFSVGLGTALELTVDQPLMAGPGAAPPVATVKVQGLQNVEVTRSENVFTAVGEQ